VVEQEVHGRPATVTPARRPGASRDTRGENREVHIAAAALDALASMAGEGGGVVAPAGLWLRLWRLDDDVAEAERWALHMWWGIEEAGE